MDHTQNINEKKLHFATYVLHYFQIFQFICSVFLSPFTNKNGAEI